MTGLVIAVLGPPALYGLAVLREERRHRLRRATRRRHPAGSRLGPPPEWIP